MASCLGPQDVRLRQGCGGQAGPETLVSCFRRFHLSLTLALTLALTLLPPPSCAAAAEESPLAPLREIGEKAAGKVKKEVEELKEGWHFRAFSGLSLTQVHLSDSGAEEEQEEDSLQWSASFDGEAKQVSETRDWRSKLLLEYGRTESSLKGSLESMDKVLLDSVYTVRTRRLVDPYASLNFRAVFTDFSRDPRSYTGTLGVGRFLIYKRKTSLVVRAGTSLRSVGGEFSAGLESALAYDSTMSERANLRLEVKAFNEYDFEGADVTGETIFLYKLAEVVSLKLSLEADYNYLPPDERLDGQGLALRLPVWPRDIALRQTLAVVIGYALL